jgi:hypothetical protein
VPQKSIVRFVFLLLIALSAAPCATAAGLYAGTAPVASQSDEDRAVALRAAFGQVIVKLSGNNAVLTRPDVVRAMSKADRYMQSYGYQNDPAQPAGHLQLVVQFDRSSIDGLLHDLGLDATADNTAAAPAAPTSGAAPNTGANPAAGASPATTPGATPAAADAGAMAAGQQNAGSYRLWITGLRSAEDYARLIGALASNEQVRSLQVEQGHGNTVQVRIEARSALPALLDALAAARIAHPTNTHPPVAGVDALLDFEP